MRFPASLLDEIRDALPVSTVVGRRVKLRRQGREYVGLSPFKLEKTPSFTVNDDKGFYHCFATGEHGDIFDFLTKMEGLSFPEAVERLAAEADIDLPKPAQAEAREAESLCLRKLAEAACVFFQAALRSGIGADARAYLERRGVTLTEIDSFRLGYAPAERHALKEHLAAKGFALADMIAAGTLVAGEDIPIAYDRFRGRLVFPITDMQGRVIAFGGRALDAGQQPKYLNSPDTPLFHKGKVLFNAAAARAAAHQRGAIIVAEGYMDVIALARAGFPNAVAPLGTALTPEQIGQLWRLAPEPVLCFDGDAAGQKAAHRAVETALPLLQPGRSLAFAFLPDGLDPDDMLRQRGPRALAMSLAEARPLVDVLWAKECAADTWDTPERRAQLETRLFALVNGIADRTVRAHYGQAIRRRLAETFAPRRTPRAVPAMRTASFPGPHDGRQPYQRQRRSSSCSIPASPPQPLPASAMPRPEALLLATVLRHPWLLDSEVEAIAAITFESPGLGELRDWIVGIAAESGQIDREELRLALEAAGAADLLAQIGSVGRRLGADASREDMLAEWRHRLAMHLRNGALKRELEDAAATLAGEFTEANIQRLRALRAQMWRTTAGA